MIFTELYRRENPKHPFRWHIRMKKPTLIVRIMPSLIVEYVALRNVAAHLIQISQAYLSFRIFYLFFIIIHGYTLSSRTIPQILG